jgi:hypothetical protein
MIADSSSRAFYGIGLRPGAYWDCGFESRRVDGYLSVVNVVCCQIEGLRRVDHPSRGVLPSTVYLSEFDSEASTVRRLWPIAV